MSTFYAEYPGRGASTGTGTVTSVGLADGSSSPIYTISGSPVTSSGTLTFSLSTQAKNLVFAGPATGSNAQPGFRAVVAADLPTGNLTDAGTDGIVVTGGTGVVIGSGTSLAQHVADASHNGYLSSADWTTFNAKQSSGNYITALTGDVTASGPGSVAATLAATTNATLVTLSALTTAGSLVTVGTVTSGTWNATTIAVNHGGTGLTSGTSGGILGYTASGTLASSGALTANQLIVGGGAGATPSVLAAGSQFQVLVMGASNPGYGQVNLGQSAAITGTLPIGNGGTGQTTATAAFDALSPTTTQGDIIYRNASNNVRLATGTNGQVLMAQGAAANPAWATVQGNTTILKAPTLQKFTSTGSTAGYVFTVTSANATVGATYTNNGNTYTVLNTIAAATVLFASNASAPQASGTLTKATGSGDASITFSAAVAYSTYTLPTNPSPIYIDIEGVGAGGAGAQGNGGTAGSAGATSYFGANMIQLGGGGGGNGISGGAAAAGGTATLGSGPVGIAVAGAGGGATAYSAAGTNFGFAGGCGGNTPFGGAGCGGTPNTVAGTAAAANSGSGGGGGAINGVASSSPGGGGGAGGYAKCLITSPAATYPLVVGAKGTNSGNGANGADGVWLIREYYQ